MTPEEIRLEAFTQAKEILTQQAYSNTVLNPTTGMVQTTFPTVQEILVTAAQIEAYISAGSRPTPTNAGQITGSNVVLSSSPPWASGSVPVNSGTSGSGPPPTSTPLMTFHDLFFESMDSSVVDDLKNDGLDIIQELETHLSQFHRVIYRTADTLDVNVISKPSFGTTGKLSQTYHHPFTVEVTKRTP